MEDRLMPKHIGIVACSSEGAALCYRTICVEAPVMMGEYMHPEISMHTYPLAEYMKSIRSGNWTAVGNLMASSAKKLSDIGAEFIVCPDNTIHQAFETAVLRSPIPWLHIAEEVAKEAHARGFSRLGVLGTRYLMTGPVYSAALEKFGVGFRIPTDEDCGRINEIIFKELVNGIFKERSRLYLNRVIRKLKKHGCDATVLGCTEIPLLVDPDDCPLPVLDSTRILARAALREALAEE
jgi:aspartate racemase